MIIAWEESSGGAPDFQTLHQPLDCLGDVRDRRLEHLGVVLGRATEARDFTHELAGSRLEIIVPGDIGPLAERWIDLHMVLPHDLRHMFRRYWPPT